MSTTETIDQEPEPTPLGQEPTKPETKGGSLATMKMSGFALVPTSFDEAFRVATMLSQSAFVPTMYRGKPQDCLAAMAYGQEVGLSPLQALQGIAVINSRPSLWGDALLAVIRAHPSVLSVSETVEGDGEKAVATCVIERMNSRGRIETTSRTFSVADAKEAKLWGKDGPWKTYSKRMLQMRARGFCARDACADILKGISMAEEMQDVGRASELNVTPEQIELPEDIQALIAKAEWKRARVELELRACNGDVDALRERLTLDLANRHVRRDTAKPHSPEPKTVEAAPTPDELLMSRDQNNMLFAFLDALEIGAGERFLKFPVKEREDEQRKDRVAWAEEHGVKIPIDPAKKRQSFSMLTEVQATKLIEIVKAIAIQCGLVNITDDVCACCGVKQDYLHKKACREIGV